MKHLPLPVAQILEHCYSVFDLNNRLLIFIAFSCDQVLFTSSHLSKSPAIAQGVQEESGVLDPGCVPSLLLMIYITCHNNINPEYAQRTKCHIGLGGPKPKHANSIIPYLWMDMVFLTHSLDITIVYTNRLSRCDAINVYVS